MTTDAPKPPDDVQLRFVDDDDLPVFFAFQQDPEAIRMANFPAREHDSHTAHWAKVLRDPNVVARTILLDGQVAGNIVSFVQDSEREVGYWIGRAFWGRGLATKALAAFLDVETTRPLFAHVAKHNVASRRVQEKCGFVIVGEESSPPDAQGESVKELVLELRF